MRVREDVGEHEPRQEVIDLVESDEHAERGGAEDVEKREHDVRADGARQRRADAGAGRRERRPAMMPVPTVMADHAMPPYSWSQKCATMPTMPMRTRANAV